MQLWKSPGFSGVLWRDFLFVQLKFGADFTIGHLLLLEAIVEERCQTNVCWYSLMGSSLILQLRVLTPGVLLVEECNNFGKVGGL